MPIYIVWAYQDTTDVKNDTAVGFPKHTAKGFEKKTLLPGEKARPCLK